MGLKESPYFLKLQHLRKLRREGQEQASLQLSGRWKIDIARDRKNTYAELFAPDMRKHSIAVGLMFFFKIIGDVQMTVLATSILAQSKGIELTGALWTIVFGNAVAILGYLLFGWLGDRIGPARDRDHRPIAGGGLLLDPAVRRDRFHGRGESSIPWCCSSPQGGGGALLRLCRRILSDAHPRHRCGLHRHHRSIGGTVDWRSMAG